MKLETRAEVSISRPVEAVFDHAFAVDTFARILRPKGPIPGLVSVTLLEGATAPGRGVKRAVAMTDESTLEEEITVHDRPREHSYRWLGRPAPPFSWLVSGGHTTWRLEPTPTGTRLVWTYWFELTTPLVLLPMLGVRALFNGWMRAGLENLRAELGG